MPQGNHNAGVFSVPSQATIRIFSAFQHRNPVCLSPLYLCPTDDFESFEYDKKGASNNMFFVFFSNTNFLHKLLQVT